jgi:hypothetical protein
MQFSSVSYHLIPHRPKYSQRPVLKRPQPMFFRYKTTEKQDAQGLESGNEKTGFGSPYSPSSGICGFIGAKCTHISPPPPPYLHKLKTAGHKT